MSADITLSRGSYAFVCFMTLYKRLSTTSVARRAPFVELGSDGEATIASGTRPRWSEAVTQAVVHRSTDEGRLTVASRGPGATFGDRELRLLSDLGSPARHSMRCNSPTTSSDHATNW